MTATPKVRCWGGEQKFGLGVLLVGSSVSIAGRTGGWSRESELGSELDRGRC